MLTHTHTCTHMHTHTYIHTHAHTTHTHKHIHTHTLIHACTHTHAHTCMHTHTLFPTKQLYNLVGVVRSHDDDEATMIEVEFHNAGTHHAFSIANHYSYTMAALSEQALVLACGRPRHTKWVCSSHDCHVTDIPSGCVAHMTVM